MRILSIIVACVSVIAGTFCILFISKFSEMFEETDTAIPSPTAIILDSSGWIPGGIFFIAAVLLTTLVIAKNDKTAGFTAITTIIVMLITAVALPVLLLMPLPTMIQAIEEPGNIEVADQTGTGQPATRPESKSEDSDKPHPESE